MKAIILLASFFTASISMADCLPNTLCVGDRVMDSSNRLAQVLEVVDLGVVKIKLDGRAFPVNRAVTALSKKTKCYQGVCTDDRVLDMADQIGTVSEVFENGKALVKFENGKSEIRVAVTLGKSVECIGKVCINQDVKDLSRNTGIILELFDSGKVLVKFDHTVFPRVRTFLSMDIQAPCKIKENCTVTTPAQAPKQTQQQKPPTLGRRGH